MTARTTQTRSGVVTNNLNQLSVETLEAMLVIIGVKMISSIGRNMFSRSHLRTVFIVRQDSIPRSSGCQSEGGLLPVLLDSHMLYQKGR